DDRADGDVVGPPAGEQRDHRDDRLRQRRSDRREQTADRSFREAKAVTGPLDGVGEEVRPREQDGEGRRQQDEAHLLPTLATAARRSAIVWSPTAATTCGRAS